MNTQVIEYSSVLDEINTYPVEVRQSVLEIRSLIFDIARSSEHVATVNETFKWAEPSYVSNAGSTIRLAWKPKFPERYGVYFVCTTKLVDTFRELYPTDFTFERNRAIVLKAGDVIPQNALSHCLELALTYKKIKDLPQLGV